MDFPPLDIRKFANTRDYLQNVAKVLGKLQQAYVATEPHGWQYGLLPVSVGLATREFQVKHTTVQVVLDLQSGVVRIGNTEWSLEEYAAPEVLNNLRVWMDAHDDTRSIATPDYGPRGSFDRVQSRQLGTAYWQLADFAERLTRTLPGGLTSPALVYPHHFDLAVAWFPFDDHQQLSFGFSSGDQTIKEPYLYLTADPEPATFTELALPNGAFWQQQDFTGAVLPYTELQRNHQPALLLQAYAKGTLLAAKPLFI